jgi:glycosyltransferase involved in cell wall biosynthesis
MSDSKYVRKKILFVLDGGFDGGGAERVASCLISNWSHSGIDVTVVSMSDAKQEFYELPNGVDRVFIGQISHTGNPISKLRGHIRNLYKLRKIIRESKADVVLSFLTRTNIRTLVAGAALKKRIVISERNDPSRQGYKPVWRILRYLLYRKATIVTTNTMSALTYMQRFVPLNKLVYIHNPVLVPEQRANPEASNKILSVGRLVPQKGQALILDAFAKLNRLDWQIEFLGDGPDNEMLLGKAKSLGIENYVSFKGFVAQPSRYYIDAGIFVLASDYEGMSNALLEAMSFGLPCVVSDALPGALEHIKNEETGLVFRSRDADDLAEKLDRLIKSPELRESLGNAGRYKMINYSVERVMKVWDEVLFSTK